MPNFSTRQGISALAKTGAPITYGEPVGPAAPQPKDWNYWKQFLNGKQAYGRAGLVSQQTPGYFQTNPQSEGGDSYTSINPRVQGHGTGAVIDDSWVQIGDNQGQGWHSANATSGIKDFSKLKWDDEFGLLSPYDNVQQDDSIMGNYAPWLIAAIAAGAYGLDGMAGAGAAQGATGTGAMDMGYGLTEVAQGMGMAPTGVGDAALAGAGAGAGGGAGNGYLDPITLDPATPSLGPQDMLSYTGGSGAGGIPWQQILKTGGSSLLKAIMGGGGSGGSGNGGGGGMGLLDLLNLGGQGYVQNRDRQQARDDIFKMIDVGNAGIGNEDRAPMKNLVKGIYDGSISGDAIFDRVPGLRAISDRGYDDIARKMSAAGDAGPGSSARMREFAKFNNELTTKAWNSEMDRAGRWGGYDFNPGQMAGQGMRALGDVARQRTQDNAGLFAGLNRAGGLSSLAGLAGQGISGLWNLFNGDDDSGLGEPTDDWNMDFETIDWDLESGL
jgi:hypothetical protein